MNTEKLKIEMEKQKISRNELAKKIDLDHRAVERWFQGRDIKSENLKKVCQILNLSADYLLDLNNNQGGVNS